MPRKVKTTGDLRAILLKTLDEVQSGAMEPSKASAIVKIAAQINMSLLTEAQIGKMNLVASKSVFDLGALPVADLEIEPPVIEHAPPAASQVVPSRLGRMVERPSPPSPSFGDPAPGRSALDQRLREQGMTQDMPTRSHETAR